MHDSLHWLVNNSPLMMAALDHNMVCRHLSDSWREYLGLPRVYRLSRPIADLLGPENRNVLVQHLEEVAAEGLELVQEPASLKGWKENQAGYLSAWRVRVPGAEHPWLIMLARHDPSGASRPEEQSRLQTLQQLVLQAAGEGILGLDSAGRTRYINEAALKALGWSEQALMGQSMHDLLQHSHLDGSPYPEKDSPITQTLNTGESRTSREEIFWCSDGTALPVACISTGIFRHGKLDGAVVLFRDISSERELESKRAGQIDRLEKINRSLMRERDYLRREVEAFFDSPVTSGSDPDNGPVALSGQNEAIARVRSQVTAIASSAEHVLVQGETGVGKEDIARAIHLAGKRVDGPLIRLDCAALPPDRLEQELFGADDSELGATEHEGSEHVASEYGDSEQGRSEQKPVGRFDLARGGTLLLSHITRLPLHVQDRLVREIQRQDGIRMAASSGAEDKPLRLLSVSHKNLLREVELGNLRKDLYFLISVFSIEVPALRERQEDVPLLARRLINLACRALGKDTPILTRHHLTALNAYAWPGNIRELKYVMQRAALLSEGSQLKLDLPTLMSTPPEANAIAGVTTATQLMTDADVREIEKSNMLGVLRSTAFKVSGEGGAAARLGIKPSTLDYRMKIFGIDKSGQQR